MAEVESIGADPGGIKFAVGVVDGRPEALWQEGGPLQRLFAGRGS